jgi:hypothetical protein
MMELKGHVGFDFWQYLHSIPMETILSKRHEWMFPEVSYHPDINIYDLVDFPNYDWDWEYLSFHLPADQILKFSDLPWVKESFLQNPTRSGAQFPTVVHFLHNF